MKVWGGPPDQSFEVPLSAWPPTSHIIWTGKLRNLFIDPRGKTKRFNGEEFLIVFLYLLCMKPPLMHIKSISFHNPVKWIIVPRRRSASLCGEVSFSQIFLKNVNACRDGMKLRCSALKLLHLHLFLEAQWAAFVRFISHWGGNATSSLLIRRCDALQKCKRLSSLCLTGNGDLSCPHINPLDCRKPHFHVYIV